MSAVPQAFITTGISLWIGLSIGWICFGCAIAQSTVFFTTARAGALSRFQGIFLWFILGAAPLHQRSRGRLELMRLSFQHSRRGRPCLTSDGRQRVRPMQMYSHLGLTTEPHCAVAVYHWADFAGFSDIFNSPFQQGPKYLSVIVVFCCQSTPVALVIFIAAYS